MGVRNLIRQFCVDLYQKIDTYILRGPVPKTTWYRDTDRDQFSKPGTVRPTVQLIFPPSCSRLDARDAGVGFWCINIIIIIMVAPRLGESRDML